jgi:hypothetical protein
MDSSNIAAIIAAVGAIVAAAIAAWVTRQGAKESERRTDQRTDQITAAGLYTQLAADQRTDLTTARSDIIELRDRVGTLEATVLTLQGIIVAFRRRARLHIEWDDELVATVNDNVPGAHIRPAPPLLEEDDVA